LSNTVVCVIWVLSDVPPFVSKFTTKPSGVAVGLFICFVVLKSCVKLCDVMLPFHVPLFGFTVNCVFIASHCAFNVISVDVFTVVVLSTLFEPLYHPLKVYPVLVGVGNSPYVSSFLTVLLAVDTVPPSASKFTVNSAPNHFAVNVVFDVIFTVLVLSILFEPLYHPSNVYPGLVGVGNVP